jgi:large subunit ribosomal protein LX
MGNVARTSATCDKLCCAVPAGSTLPNRVTHLYGRRDGRAIPLKPFRVTGKFRMGLILTNFTMETIAKDKKGAEDRILATIGSRHRVNRHQITIGTVEELKTDQVTDPVVEKQLSMVK